MESNRLNQIKSDSRFRSINLRHDNDNLSEKASNVAKFRKRPTSPVLFSN